MPTGVYERKSKSGQFPKGSIPHNKGIRADHVMKKIDLFKNGLPIECKYHGIHTDWRMHSGDNVQCKICSRERQKNGYSKNYPKRLVRWAQQRGRECNITEEYIRELINSQNNKCALSDIEFDEINKPSLDRIDSNQGYIIGNIQIVIFDINRMKSNFTQDYYIELCKAVARNNNAR